MDVDREFGAVSWEFTGIAEYVLEFRYAKAACESRLRLVRERDRNHGLLELVHTPTARLFPARTGEETDQLDAGTNERGPKKQAR